MWTEITNLLAICVSYASSVFLVVVAACGGAMAAFFGVFIMHQAVRLLLGPLIGIASSDTVGAWYSGTKLGRSNADKFRANKRTPTAPRQRYHGEDW